MKAMDMNKDISCYFCNKLIKLSKFAGCLCNKYGIYMDDIRNIEIEYFIIGNFYVERLLLKKETYIHEKGMGISNPIINFKSLINMSRLDSEEKIRKLISLA